VLDSNAGNRKRSWDLLFEPTLIWSLLLDKCEWHMALAVDGRNSQVWQCSPVCSCLPELVCIAIAFLLVTMILKVRFRLFVYAFGFYLSAFLSLEIKSVSFVNNTTCCSKNLKHNAIWDLFVTTSDNIHSEFSNIMTVNAIIAHLQVPLFLPLLFEKCVTQTMFGQKDPNYKKRLILLVYWIKDRKCWWLGTYTFSICLPMMSSKNSL
jgi:hypothetical protein